MRRNNRKTRRENSLALLISRIHEHQEALNTLPADADLSSEGLLERSQELDKLISEYYLLLEYEKLL